MSEFNPDRYSPLRQNARRRTDRDIADFFANANIGMQWLGPDGIILWANPYEMEWLGYSKKEYIGHHVSEFYVEKEQITDIMRRLHADEIVDNEEVCLRAKDSTIRYGLMSSSVFREKGRFIHTRNFTRDITDRKKAEQKIIESERRFHDLADAAPVMIWTTGTNREREYISKAWLEFTGKTFKESIGMGWLTSVHPDDREHLLQAYTNAFNERRSYKTEYRLHHKDGQYRWMFSNGTPRFTQDGTFIGYIGSIIDINARKQYEEKMRFLAEVNKILFVTLDYETTLRSLATSLVPQFADWVSIDIMEGNSLRSVIVAHKDPQKGSWAHEISKKYQPDPHAQYGIAKVIRTGQSEFYKQMTLEILERVARDAEHLQFLKDMGIVSVMIVPLKVQDKIFGALSFIQAESKYSYTPEDLVLAEEVARIAAIAIDNAKLYNKIRESDNAKTQFLSMLAHELRNPMAPILSSIQLLQYHAPTHDVVTRETVSMIERQVRQMSRLLDDLLDVSRIIHGKIQLSKKETDLNTVVSYAIETTRMLKEEFKHTLSVSLPSHPVLIDADPVRIEQIIVNLLNNAYKYTEPHGTVWLTVTQQNNQSVIRVKDTGVGIAPQMISKVFELFTQIDNTLSRSYGGMGIGLTLVKSLVEMHGGTISVESAGLGHGSEFIVRMPLSVSVREQPQQNFEFSGLTLQAPTVSLAPPTAQKILVVDDNRDAAHALGRLLEHLRHEVRYAYGGMEALHVAQEYQPGIVLLDIGLPEMNGYEVARQLRKDPLLKGTLLVAISGYGQEEDRLRSQEAGFDYHFTKPVGIDVLTKIFA